MKLSRRFRYFYENYNIFVTSKRKRYPRTYGLYSPKSVRDSSTLSIDIASQIVRSVNFWPKGTALQIDIFSNKTDRFGILLAQLGDYFPDWSNEIFDILGPFTEVSPWTNKERNQVLKDSKPKEMYELVPYGTNVHFDAQDIMRFDENSEDANIYRGTNLHEKYIDEQLKMSIAVPYPRPISGLSLIRILTSNPQSTIRVILSPVSQKVADDVRSDTFHRLINCQDWVDLSTSVVNARCFIGSHNSVPVGLKRIATAMAADTELSKLNTDEITKVWNYPLDSIEGYAKIGISASALIRIPFYEYTQDERRLTKPDLKKIIQLQKKYFEDLEKELKEKILTEIRAELSNTINDIIRDETAKKMRSQKPDIYHPDPFATDDNRFDSSDDPFDPFEADDVFSQV